MARSPVLTRDGDIASSFPCFPPAARAVAALPVAGCRWPLGEPTAEGFAFCAAERSGGRMYCQAHALQARVARP